MIEASIIVPVYNDASGLETTVLSLASQLTPDAELIIVDNDSTDDTPATAAALADGSRIRYTSETETQSSYAARNEGIRQARGDELAFVDADMTASEGWLEAGRDALSQAPYVGCRIDLEAPAETFSLASRYDWHTAFPVWRYIEYHNFAPTCGLFVHRDVIEDVGAFDPRLTSGGDKEFGQRVARAGYDQRYCEDARLEHPTRDSLADLVRKDLRIGAGLCQLQRYYPDRYGMAGRPPAPSGVKSPDRSPAFRVLAAALTGVRGLGYYREFLRLLRTGGGGGLETGRPGLALEASGGGRDD